MKLVMIMYNEAINDEVQGLLERNGVDGFTQWTRVFGKGRSSGPHLGTHIWPKANNVLAVAAEERTAGKIIEGVKEIRKRFAKEGLKAFMWEIEEVR